MVSADEYGKPHSPTKRPLGIWIITIWLGLFAGLAPILLVLFLYFGPAKGGGIIGPAGLIGSISLGASIMYYAYQTWRGNSTARYGLVILVAIHYGFVAYQNF